MNAAALAAARAVAVAHAATIFDGAVVVDAYPLPVATCWAVLLESHDYSPAARPVSYGIVVQGGVVATEKDGTPMDGVARWSFYETLRKFGREQRWAA